MRLVRSIQSVQTLCFLLTLRTPIPLLPSYSLFRRTSSTLVCWKEVCCASEVKLLRGNVKRLWGVLVFEAHRLWYHSTLGWRVIKQKKRSSLTRFLLSVEMYTLFALRSQPLLSTPLFSTLPSLPASLSPHLSTLFSQPSHLNPLLSPLLPSYSLSRPYNVQQNAFQSFSARVRSSLRYHRGLAFQALKLSYHSILGSRVIEKKKKSSNSTRVLMLSRTTLLEKV